MVLKVLIVEDDEDCIFIAKRAVQGQHMECAVAHNGIEALELLEAEYFDIIILDMMMPKMDGYQFLRKLAQLSRAAKKIKGNRDEIKYCVPVIITSARNESADILEGFNLGSDDYLPKPFNVDELVERIYASLRRYYGAASNTIEITDKFIFDLKQKQFLYDQMPVAFTKLQLQLLLFLVKNRGKVISREQIFFRLYGSKSNKSSETVDQLLHKVRSKLIELLGKDIITSKYNEGFVLQVY